MKKLKKLNETVREYNGIMARFSKDRSKENQALVDEVIAKLKAEVDEVLVD